MTLTSDKVGAAAAALKGGDIVLLYDGLHPDLGGYLCASARKTTPETTNFMATHGRGLICIGMTEEKMASIGIPVLVPSGPFSQRPAFGASIEAKTGVTTGISAADRARTIVVATSPEAGPDDIVMPGHVFPIQVREGGVVAAPGIPEASVDLVAMAGDEPSSALCAILDEHGELADPDALAALAQTHDLIAIDVATVVAYRLRHELAVVRVAEREIESGYGGTFNAIVYRSPMDNHEHMALIAGDLEGDEPVSVRVHSQCLTGDVFGSTRCDCGDQLALALRRISEEGRGVLIYMHQEGRGIGLANKMRAYELQDCGRDTVEANLELGFKEDLRDYGITAQIIKDLRIAAVRLLTNNPQKLEGLRSYGVNVVERSPIEASPRSDNIGYLRTKREKLGHLLDDTNLGEKGEVS